MKLFVAQGKHGCPVIIWVCDKSEQLASPREEVDSKAYNRFVCAKTSLAILQAIDSLGPLYLPTEGVPSTISDEAHTIGDIKEAWSNDFRKEYFSPCIPESVQAEMTLYPFSKPMYETGPINKNNQGDCSVPADGQGLNNLCRQNNTFNKRALRDAVSLFSLNEAELSHFEDDVEVYVESLSDWILVRNALVYCSELYSSNIDGRTAGSWPNSATSYEIVDMKASTKDSRIDSFLTCLVSPVNYERLAEEYQQGSQPQAISLMRQTPLLHLLTDPVAAQDCSTVPYISSTARSKKSFYFAYLNTWAPFSSKQENIELNQHFIWLVLQDGRQKPERNISSDVFSLFQESLFRGPKGQWADVLDGSVPEGPEESNGGCRLGVKSMIAALWHRMLFHPGMALTTCEHCGNTVLSSARGHKSKYCSSACRIAAHREGLEYAKLEL